MEEKEILLKTIDGLNASIASLSATNRDQAAQIKNLQERIRELTTRVAWLNRQLFGRKSGELRTCDPNMPDLFAGEFAGLQFPNRESHYVCLYPMGQHDGMSGERTSALG